MDIRSTIFDLFDKAEGLSSGLFEGCEKVD